MGYGHTIQGHQGKALSTSQRYRLLADGTILDRKLDDRVVGYIMDEEKLDEVYKLRGKALQKALEDFLKEV